MPVRGPGSPLSAAIAAAWIAWAPWASAQPGAAELRAAYERLAPGLATSGLGRPMVLASAETPAGLKGEVHGVLDQPLATISAALEKPARWCEMLMLHLNNRGCKADEARQELVLSVVRRYDIPPEQAFQLPFRVHVASAMPDYFDAKLTSGKGPFGTRNYVISLQGIPLANGKSFVRFSYSYEQSSATRVATQSYLSTFGRGKVGFTVVGKLPSGEPELVGGMRGLIERNGMRYFLAVDAYSAAPDDLEKRLGQWHAATRKFPRQLQDASEADYLKFKRMDHQRMGTERR
jgi:hypothetical protein